MVNFFSQKNVQVPSHRACLFTRRLVIAVNYTSIISICKYSKHTVVDGDLYLLLRPSLRLCSYR